MADMEESVGLYTLMRDNVPYKFIYGPSWYAQALFMGDMKGYNTAEEAKAAWDVAKKAREINGTVDGTDESV